MLHRVRDIPVTIRLKTKTGAHKDSIESVIEAAFAALESGKPYRVIEKQYGVQRATLHYRRHHYRNARPVRR